MNGSGTIGKPQPERSAPAKGWMRLVKGGAKHQEMWASPRVLMVA
jgi:hypothetical protein